MNSDSSYLSQCLRACRRAIHKSSFYKSSWCRDYKSYDCRDDRRTHNRCFLRCRLFSQEKETPYACVRSSRTWARRESDVFGKKQRNIINWQHFFMHHWVIRRELCIKHKWDGMYMYMYIYKCLCVACFTKNIRWPVWWTGVLNVYPRKQ